TEPLLIKPANPARIPARRSLRSATPLLSPEQIGVFRCGRVVQTKLRRPQQDALGKKHKRARKKEFCADQIVTFAVGNNVGISLGEFIFRINDLCRLVRSEGLEPPRCYSLPPQGSASTSSATSAWETGLAPCGRPDQRRRCNKSRM